MVGCAYPAVKFVPFAHIPLSGVPGVLPSTLRFRASNSTEFCPIKQSKLASNSAEPWSLLEGRRSCARGNREGRREHSDDHTSRQLLLETTDRRKCCNCQSPVAGFRWGYALCRRGANEVEMNYLRQLRCRGLIDGQFASRLWSERSRGYESSLIIRLVMQGDRARK